jgi:ferrochelatase
VPWLGPQIEDLVGELAKNGERNLLIAPIGFIADHVEVLYDIDIGVQNIARAAGVRVERPPMLNDSPAMVATLAAIVQGARQGVAPAA